MVRSPVCRNSAPASNPTSAVLIRSTSCSWPPYSRATRQTGQDADPDPAPPQRRQAGAVGHQQAGDQRGGTDRVVDREVLDPLPVEQGVGERDDPDAEP